MKILQIGTKGEKIIIGLDDGDCFHPGFKILDIDHDIRLEYRENNLEEVITLKSHFTFIRTSIYELLLVN